MSFAIVKWNKPSIYFFGDLRLMPGANEATKEQITSIKNHFICQAQMECGDLEIIEKPENSQGLGGFKNADAVKLIQATLDKQLLSLWAQIEKRPQVLKAISDQLTRLAIEPAVESPASHDEKDEHFK